MALRGNSKGGYREVMSFQDPETSPGIQIPKAKGIVQGSTDAPFPIGRDDKGADRVLMPFQRPQVLLEVQVPDTKGMVIRPADTAPAVRGKGDADDPGSMPY